MTALNDFPYENLVNIFSTLSHSNVARVALVTRRWHMISEPLLYFDPFGTTGQETWTGPTPITRLVRTLLSPGGERLAAHFRGINLDWSKSETELTPLCTSDTAIIAAAESRFGVAHRSVPGSIDSHVVLLMHLLPRLKHLLLRPQNPERCCFDAISPTQPLPLSFQSLTRFTCEWENTNDGVSPLTLLALLHLPHLRVVCVGLGGDIDDHFPTDICHTSGVTELTLEHREPTAPLVRAILSAPRALEYPRPVHGCVSRHFSAASRHTDIHPPAPARGYR